MRIALYAAALLWLNLYICRDLFLSGFTGHHNSVQGLWIAMVRHAGEHWFQPAWWRFWDGGMPWEFTYQPLVPAVAALIHQIGFVPPERAIQSASGIFFCLAPLSLFCFAAVVSRAPGWSFAAAVFYSLLAPTQWIVPDQPFGWHHIGDARQLYLMAVWDETPHVAALTMLPLALLFAYRRKWLLTGVFFALAVLANAFGATLLLMGLAAFLLAYGWDRAPAIAGTAALAYLAVCPFVPPSLLQAIRENANNARSESSWNIGSWTALAIVILGITLIQWALERRGATPWTRFVVLFAWITTSTPVLFQYAGRFYLPQPGRYKVEAAMGLSLLAVFAARALLRHTPSGVRTAVALLALALAAEQTVSHRKFEKLIVRTMDVTRTIEYRTARWLEANVAGRVFLPGSIAQWANAFGSVEQFAGSSYSTAYNPVQQMAYWELFTLPPEHARTAILWWKAFGVQAAVVTGKQSPEFWKAFAHPQMYEGVLPVLWREDDTTVYRVPQRTTSYAHGVSREALVRDTPRWISDTGQLERYVAALNNATPSSFRWTGSSSAQIEANLPPGEVLSVQVTHHPGWRARAGGRSVIIHKDGLGLLWLDPGCDGPCTVSIEYTGSTEQALTRWISLLTLAGISLWLARGMVRRRGSHIR